MPIAEFARRQLFRVLRAGFRLTPLPAATRDRLRQRFLDRYSGLIPSSPRGIVSSSPNRAHRPLRLAGGRAVGHMGYRPEPLPECMPATLVAFYLPQFHPIPENDAWWGRGFTEWSNVTRALPQFDGHAQPRLPGDLGFYDLRHAQTVRSQMQLAHEYGIGAFCTYFYWFAGKTLLEAPLQAWLEDSSLDLPICLCWANENWSRRWDGRVDDVLIAQRHSSDDDLGFIAYVSRYLADPRYLRVDGKPMLLVYRPGLLPDPRATAGRWRAWCLSHGIGEIHLAYVQSFDRVDPRDIGFDAAVEFPPNNTTLAPITAEQQLINPDFRGEIFDWRALAKQSLDKPNPPYLLYPGVNPGWDNEARRSGCGRAYLHASPRGYRDWLGQAIDRARHRAPAMPLVFINAWNEWAEGAVLEPDTRLGHAWLDATRQALRPKPGRGAPSPPCAVIHAWHIDALGEIAQALIDSGMPWRIIITTSPQREQAVREYLGKLKVDAEIAVFENRGRDVLPFLQVANRLLDEGTEVVLKLHTKRSTHRQDGDAWRRELVERLLSPGRCEQIYTAFEQDQALGLVAAEGHVQPLSYYWGANEANVSYLCRRIGMKQPAPDSDRFIAGTMFWARLEAIRPLLDAHLDLWEFEDELGQVDGTMAHAVERIFMLAATSAGQVTREATEVCDTVDPPDGAAPYPYARRSG